MISFRSTTRSMASTSSVCNEGIQSFLNAFRVDSSIKVTNLMMLTGFQTSKALSDITFADVAPYIASGAIMGNNDIVNPDGSRDVRAYMSSEAPYELTLLGTIPAEKLAGSVFNAAVLVLNGDVNQTVSNNVTTYQPVGTERVLAVSMFDNIIKSDKEPYAISWILYNKIE